MGNKVNFKSGTPTDYNNTSHDDETFYHVVNDNATINHIYLGDLQLDNEDISGLEEDINSLEDKFNADGQALDSAHADNADVADKLGTATVGSGTKPIYLSSGTATASSSTVGSTSQPVYLNSGTISAMSGTLSTTYGGTGNTTNTATYATTTANTSSSLYPVGVTSSATTTLQRDTNMTIVSGRIRGTYSGDPLWRAENTSSSGATSIQVQSDWANDGNGRIISLHIGSGGSNRGIYDNTDSAWIIYKDSSDNVHLGTSTVGSSSRPIYLSSGVPTAMTGTLSTTYGGTGNSTGTATYVTTTSDSSSTLYLLGVTSSANTTVRRSSSIIAIGATLYAGGTGTMTTTHIQAGRIILYNSVPYIRFASQDSSTYTHYIEANSTTNLIAYPGISNSSDERLKHDIVDMPDKYISLFDKLQPKEFRMNRGNGLKVGVIAQDILQSEAELGITESILVSGDGEINEDDDTNYYAVDYSAIAVISINKIKQLEQEINNLKNIVTKGGE